jgi:hypothetical protein
MDLVPQHAALADCAWLVQVAVGALLATPWVAWWFWKGRKPTGATTRPLVFKDEGQSRGKRYSDL